jgi:putative Holliday junction resolvase
MSGNARTVLGFDFGLRTIGVAVGNDLLGTATALRPVAARDGVPDWKQIERLIAEWQPGLLVVGLPLNMDGTESEMSRRAARFARRLSGRFNIRCELMDERLSSFEARDQLAASEHGRRESVDSLAARLILQSWFASGGEAR